MNMFETFNEHGEIDDFISSISEANELFTQAVQIEKLLLESLDPEGKDLLLNLTELLNRRAVLVQEHLFNLAFEKGQQITTSALSWIQQQQYASSTLVTEVSKIFDELIVVLRKTERNLHQVRINCLAQIQKGFLFKYKQEPDANE